jgi:hypothetical protein
MAALAARAPAVILTAGCPRAVGDRGRVRGGADVARMGQRKAAAARRVTVSLNGGLAADSSCAVLRSALTARASQDR